MNIGSVEASFEIKGLKQSIQQLDQARNVLGKIDDTFTTSKTTLKSYAESWKAINPQIASAISNAKSARQAFSNVTEYKKSIVELAKLAKEYANTAKAAEKLKVAANVAPVVTKTKTSKITSTPASNTKQTIEEIKNASAAMQTHQGTVSKWFQHFGRVAIGFAIAYRAINAIENAFIALFDTLRSGIKTMDDIRASGATVAGMLAMLDKSQGGFTQNFNKHFAAFQGVFQRALVLLPQYSLTLEQFNAGIRELAQFGVTVNNDNLEKSIVSMKVIQEVAANTGTDTRQLRQEIQAFFNGQARMSDQFARFIKSSMPELQGEFDKMRKSGKSTQEMWTVLIEKMSQLGPAMKAGAKTVETQLLVMKNSLSIVSAKAVSVSGIYDTWLSKLMNFNQSLFDSRGGLTTFGKTVYDGFYRAWQVIAVIVTGLTIIVKTAKVFGETIWSVFKSNFMQGFLTTLGSIYATFAQILIIVGSLVGEMLKLANVAWVGKLAGALIGLHSIVLLSAFSWGLLVTRLKAFAATSLVSSIIDAVTKLYVAFSTGGLVALVRTVGAAAVSFGLLAAELTAAVAAGLVLGGVLVAVGTDMKNIFSPDADPMAGRTAWKNYWDSLIDTAKGGANAIKDIFGGTAVGQAITPDVEEFGKNYQAIFDKIIAESLKLGKDLNTNLNIDILGDKGEAAANAWGAAWSDALRDIKFDKLDKIDYKIGAEVMTPYYDAIKAYNDKMAEDFNLTFLKIRLEADSFGNYLGNSFKGLFSSVFAHEVTSFAQFFQGALKSIQQSFSDMLSDMVSDYFTAMMRMQFQQGAPNILAGLFGGGQVSGTSNIGIDSSKFSLASLTSLPPASASNGNFSLLSNYPNYAGGMINEPVFGVGKSGATYSFAEKGPERVLSNSETKDYGRSSGAPTTINFINESGIPMTATQSAPQFDGEKYVIGIVVNQMATNPSFRSSMRG